MTNYKVNHVDCSYRTFPITEAEILQANFNSIKEISFFGLFNGCKWNGLCSDYGVALWRVKVKQAAAKIAA